MPEAGRRGSGQLLCSGCRVSVLQSNKVLEMDGDGGHNRVNVFNTEK